MGHYVTSVFRRSLHEVAGYSEIHIRYNVLIPGLMAAHWPWRCWILQLVLLRHLLLGTGTFWKKLAVTM
jgi:hypothetical protein